MYAPDGYMSAQIQSAVRPDYDKAVASGGTPETGDLRHEAKLSLVPNYLGQFHLPHTQLDEDRLTLSAEMRLPDGRTLYSSLGWARASGSGSQVA